MYSKSLHYFTPYLRTSFKFRCRRRRRQQQNHFVENDRFRPFAYETYLSGMAITSHCIDLPKISDKKVSRQIKAQ